MKRVRTLEREIVKEDQVFALEKQEDSFPVKPTFNWNEINLEDLLEVHQLNSNDFFEQLISYICQKKRKNVAKLEESMDSEQLCSCDSDPWPNDQPIAKIGSNEKISNQSNDKLSSSSFSIEQTSNQPTVYRTASAIIHCLITDVLNNRLATNEQSLSVENILRSLFKVEKTTSTHSLLSISPIV
ncbi:unnamed protein product [Adineta ricciae]|uniref:Uncharacterized protein n=1 Tax=Adineta ricciae TaxID=249248 RepID=A0A813MXQ8_ADIRI|nr:unnamed protein product [Adineta ricciae]